MGERRLYKYLDANGGLLMLYNRTLMFTNATQLNDPFDCHPVYIDYKPNSSGLHRGIPASFYSEMEYQKGLNRRDKTYICSLSKVYDSTTMWSYYNDNKGICVGLDTEKVRLYTKRMSGMFLGCPELEVAYRGSTTESKHIDVPTFTLCNLFATKEKDWQHEQEVRLVSYDPLPTYMRLLPGQDDKNGPIPWKEVRAFLDISGECFESVYLGINMKEKDKENIIKVAKERNPDIKIYQMTIDPKAFRLKEELITI